MNIRKIIALAAALTLISASGCGKKKDNDSSSAPADPGTQAVTSDTDTPEDTTDAPADDTPAETTAPPQTASEDTDTSTTAAEASAPGTTDTAAAQDTSTDTPADQSSGGFSYNSDGAVEFSDPAAEQTDSTLIAAAQALFESACSTEWSFTVGSPYPLDYTQYVENDLGWQFYLITEPGINSLADIEADYHRVFSDKYPTTLSEVFMESGGRAYSLNGSRGSDIFYEYSQITSVDSRTDDEIFFTVTNYYNGEEFGMESYTEEYPFSAVIGSDGVWRAGVFTLPY